MSKLLETICDPDPAALGRDVHEFLTGLGGPVEIRVTGVDSSAWRAAVVLMHGNEPSGPIAAFRWLRAATRPAVDVSLFVLAVDAAIEPPGFAHRMLPGKRDLNRCFAPPFDDDNGRLAEEILSRVRRRPCQALVDIHNNTGQNPAYGIINRPGLSRVKLVELFAESCCVLSDLVVGALTEVIVSEMPCVAIECGHAGDPAAHDLALAGLTRLFGTPDLALDRPPARPIAMFEHPIRVCLRPGLSVSFGDHAEPGCDLTLRAGIDTHNFRSLQPGTVLGWLGPGVDWPLVAMGAEKRDVSRDHFTIVGSELVFASRRVPVMMTSNARVAAQDCLCYLMQPREAAAAE